MSNKRQKKKVETEEEKDSLFSGKDTAVSTHKSRDIKGLFLPGNTFSVKRFKSPEELAIKIEEYFIECKEEKRPYTIAGLAFHLGFTNRMSLWNYENEEGYEAFHEIIQRAKMIIQMQLEEHMMTKQNVTGAIFISKNYGYTDSQTIDLTSKNAFLTQLMPTAPEPKTIDLNENNKKEI